MKYIYVLPVSIQHILHERIYTQHTQQIQQIQQMLHIHDIYFMCMCRIKSILHICEYMPQGRLLVWVPIWGKNPGRESHRLWWQHPVRG